MESETVQVNAFKQQLFDIYKRNNGRNHLFLTKDEYYSIIEEIKVAQTDSSSKTNRQYYLLKRQV